MKYISAVLILLIWFLATFIFTISIIGIAVLALFYDEWINIPKQILKIFEN
jgi:ABC-type transport system involved in multi-copper enzyme maturation permease subunit